MILTLAYIGPVDRAEKRCVASITGQKKAKSRQYDSLNQLINDRKRPDFDIVVVMPGHDTQDLWQIKRLIGPRSMLYLDLKASETQVQIHEKVAIVLLPPKTNPEIVLSDFQAAARNYSRHWPRTLVVGMEEPTSQHRHW